MIAIYVHDLSATGVVRNAIDIARELAEHGHVVELVTALGGDDHRVPPGVSRHALLDRAGRRAIEHIRAAPALSAYLGRRRPAVLLSAGNHGHATAWAALRGHRVPRIYHISNDVLRFYAPERPLKRLERAVTSRLLAADADHIVCVAPQLLGMPAFAAANRRGRVSTIVNGIDLEKVRNLAAQPVEHRWLGGPDAVVLGIGRLARQKNFGMLIEALAIARRIRPIRLIILGESRDDARSTLLAQASALGIGDAVDLPGRVDNVFPWLARADVFALPSLWEGAANVLIEAIACGVPVVAAISAGNAGDVLDQGRYGRLVEPDEPEQMAAALLAQTDPATMIRPGRRADDYALSDTLTAWRRLIEDVIRPAPSAGTSARRSAPLRSAR